MTVIAIAVLILLSIRILILMAVVMTITICCYCQSVLTASKNEDALCPIITELGTLAKFMFMILAVS